MLSVRNIRPRYPKFDGLDTYTVGMSGHRMDKLFGWSGPPGGVRGVELMEHTFIFGSDIMAYPGRGE